MKAVRIFLLPWILFLFACSQGLSSNVDIDKVQADVQALTVSLFDSMSKGTARDAYHSILDEKARGKISETNFVTMCNTIGAKLGELKSLEPGARTDVDPYSGGMLARLSYTGHFKNGDADIAIAAFSAEGRMTILSFNVNSPLLLANASDYRRNVELYVTKADLVMPGAHAKVIALEEDGKVLVEDAVVLNVRWKVAATNEREGFVTVALSATDAAAVSGTHSLSVRARQ
jgi:hypothetical protein